MTNDAPLNGETLLPLAKAASVVAEIDGKPPSYQKLWYWCDRGLRGVVLEHVCVGGSLSTSREALQRFFARVAEARERKRRPKPARSCRREDDVRRAHEELGEAGI